MLAGNEKPLEERDFPDESDLDGDDDEAIAGLTRCPSCGQLVYEDTPRCPHCKEWIVRPGQQWRLSRKWYVRAGLYLTKTILINWVFWLVMAAVAAVVSILEMVE